MSTTATQAGLNERLNDYYELTKPRVVMLIVFTAIVGMFLATPGLPPLEPFLLGTIGIALCAASAAVINQVVDRQIDARMSRTAQRPIVQGHVGVGQAYTFAAVLGVLGAGLLIWRVNALTAWLTLASLVGYALVYTLYLKRATPQNIVIGGASGAAPPVLGWVAITGEIHAHALLLFLIIFVWTPPHFWALAIDRREDYARAGIPMLPVTHGDRYTRLQILCYTVLLALVTLLPYLTGMSGVVYLVAVLGLNAGFLWYAVRLYASTASPLPMQTFGYSILYLMGLFTALLVDHYVPI
ncbi:MAG: heme o synthase [Abyssibacter sp.]|jgi:protoheme IX farnesyltransferase|nr:heme o synthase [Abyssibacter sp.]MBB86928.1 protoheme IX farnesyltransferase [Xanthomonadales bacterium]MCK5858842.1 heme o synthase [Abyssibacter sp.]